MLQTILQHVATGVNIELFAGITIHQLIQTMDIQQHSQQLL